jgi:hypothetical protein
MPDTNIYIDTNTNNLESYHHSGKAGYCRLFIPQYFQKLNETIVNSNDNSAETSYILSLLPNDSIIALETDQLLLVSVDQLYDQFQAFDDDDIVAAAENYQPWVIILYAIVFITNTYIYRRIVDHFNHFGGIFLKQTVIIMSITMELITAMV